MCPVQRVSDKLKHVTYQLKTISRGWDSGPSAFGWAGRDVWDGSRYPKRGRGGKFSSEETSGRPLLRAALSPRRHHYPLSVDKDLWVFPLFFFFLFPHMGLRGDHILSPATNSRSVNSCLQLNLPQSVFLFLLQAPSCLDFLRPTGLGFFVCTYSQGL